MSVQIAARSLAALAALLAISAALAALSRPHAASAWLPVQVQLAASADDAWLAWGDAPDERVPLTPLDGDQQRLAGILPPVPIETLALMVTPDAAPQELVIGGASSPQQRTLGAANFARSESSDPVYRTVAPLALNRPLDDPAQLLALWLVPAAVVSLVVAIPIHALQVHPLSAGSTTNEQTTERHELHEFSRIRDNSCNSWLSQRWFVEGAALVVLALYLAHRMTMPVHFSDGDTHWFLWKGVTFAETGRMETETYEWELNKLPGYPLLYALVITAVGHSLAALTLAQALLFCAALYAVGRALLGYVPPVVAAGCVLVMAASPVQLFYASTLLSDSLATALTLFGLACLLALGRARGRVEWLWLLAVIGCAAAGSLVRVNGLFICAPLALLYGQRLLHGELKLPQLAVRAMIAGVVALAPLAALSIRNAQRIGIFAPLDMAGVQSLHGALVSGALDPRVSALQPHYADLSAIMATGGSLAFPLRHTMFLSREQTPAAQRAAVREVNTTLRLIAGESLARNRLLHLAAFQHALVRGVVAPDIVDISNEGHTIPHSLGYAGEATQRVWVEAVKATSPHNTYDLRPDTGALRDVFDNWHLAYQWYYRLVLAAAMLAALAVFVRRNVSPLTFAPLAVVLLNLLFVSAILTPYGRYIQVLDVLLVAQVALAYPALRALRLPRPHLSTNEPKIERHELNK